MLLLLPIQSNAENETNIASKTGIKNVEIKSNSISETDVIELVALNVQLARLKEIENLHLSTISRSEKKLLREEVKSIENDHQRWNRRNHDRHCNSD